MPQVTYRVIHLADGQVEEHADGAAAVSVVTGFPTATQAITPPVTQVGLLFLTCSKGLWCSMIY